MAKSKDDNLENVTFMGKQIDPDLQKKVDEYMQDQSTEGAVLTEVPQSGTKIAVVDDSEADPGSAPLLPIDKLPIKIEEEIKGPSPDENDTVQSPEINNDQDLLSTEDSEPQVNSEPEQEDLTEEEHPLDSELIDLESDSDNESAPEFDDDLDPNKTVGELTDDNTTEDKGLDEVINEIVAEDADKVLEIEDEKAKTGAVFAKNTTSRTKNNILKTIFSTPLYRNIFLALLGFGLLALFVVPGSRYFALNSLGVRVSASVKILDDKTSLPLKNVEVIINGKSSKSDDQGIAKVEKIKLGKQDLIIKKLAFADITRKVTLGWGSNPLGEQRLVPTGTQYTFIAKDYVSDEPVSGIEVSLGDSSAKFSDKGEAVLTVPTVNQDEIEVSITGDKYREEKVKLKTNKKEATEVKMVISKKQVFVSKRSGKFDLYKGDIDGKNQEVILSATGIEKESGLSLSVHPSKSIAAFASSRENSRNKDGHLLTSLNLIYLDTNEVVKVTQSERIQLVDWSGDRLVYVKITEGASQANPNRHKLMSYDVEKNTETELASTNYFNDVVSVNGVIYYSPSVYKINGQVGLYKINADGTNKKTIYGKEVWNIFRTSYDKFSISVGQDWYEVSLANDEVKKVGGAPPVLKSRVYIDSPDKKHSLWIDDRDGKSVLLQYSLDKKSDQLLLSEKGIQYPIYWFDNQFIVYRVSNSTETADYIVSVGNGRPKKIADVTDTVGVDSWYYF